jgi:hypothetical protein
MRLKVRRCRLASDATKVLPLKAKHQLYLIWSHEHNAWWGPEERGYTNFIRAAGRYLKQDAMRICARPAINRDPNHCIPEYAVLRQ